MSFSIRKRGKEKETRNDVGENLEDYLYPLKNSGKELDDKERSFFRSCKEYFDSFDKTTWNLKSLYYFMANKGSIKFTVTLLKEIYIGWLQQFLMQGKININFYISKSNEAKSTKLIHETIKTIKKEKLRVLNLEDENINQWPWNFRNSSTITTPSSPIQNRLKEEILKGSFEELDQDNPLCSNILDVSDPDSWLKPFFNDDEWNELSDISDCIFNSSDFTSVINESNLNEIKNHFSYLRRNGEYKEEYDINEGTWMSHSVTIPFNIAARDIQKLRLLVFEKGSISSKKRKNEDSSSDEIDKENKITKKKKARKGRKPDLKFISKETYTNQGKVNFELLVGEVCSSPWEEKQPKTLSDLNKMIKMMKDCKDLISRYFYHKYGNDRNIDYNNNGVNIYGVLVTGFVMKIFVLDQPGYGIYRVRLVTSIDIPVKNSSGEEIFYENLDKLMQNV